MLKININGITREMTVEEEIAYLEEIESINEEPQSTAEKRIAALEEALAALLEGAIE